MQIRSLEPSDYPAVAAIYLEGIATGQATFQTDAPAWEGWDKSHFAHSRLGIFIDDELAGWAALSMVSSRCVYNGVAEVSIYIGDKFRGRGIGKVLFSALIKDSETHNIWTLQSSMFPENFSSISLHEKLGFRQVGFREKIGRHHGVWRNTILMERRSTVSGQ